MKDDAISRQAVLELLNEYDPRLLMRSDYRKMVEDLPSVSTEKTGRWEKLSVGYGCSECSLCTNIHGTQDFKYCPQCGCRMMGVEE